MGTPIDTQFLFDIEVVISIPNRFIGLENITAPASD
jgi:hypothetical protein